MEKIIYDENNVQKAQLLVEEIKMDLYKVDCLLYEGVMKTAYAKGMDLVTYENPSIDMNKPEKIMINCRESIKVIEETLKTEVQEINKYFKEHKED